MGKLIFNFCCLNSIPHYQLISSPEQLGPLYAALDRVTEIALDTEADNLFRFRTKVCLMQILAGGEIFLVDMLADLPLDGLWSRLATRHLVMHGSDYDLRLMRELCDFEPLSIFDTMFAAQLLNIPRFGLAALLEQNFGIKLDKDNQKANWSKRPLTKDLLDYAALDVHHLPALRDRLTAELQRLGRFAWLEQKCRWQIEAARDGFAAPDENAWRISGSERLGDRGLGVLHSVWHWRQHWAEKLDTPPFKVTGNELIMRIVRAADEGQPIDDVLNFHLGRRHDRLAPSLDDAIRQGFSMDVSTLPRRERRREFNPMSLEELSRQDRVKALRDHLAARLNLEPTLIATRSQLVLLARNPACIDEVLLPWQAELLKSDTSWQT